MLPRTWLVDASIYIFRAYFALPENWHAANGYPTQAVVGYAGFLLELIERERPDFAAVAFDESLGGCFRNEIYPDYKKSRVLPDEALAFQLAACRALTRALGFADFASERFEADDLIASAARHARAQGLACMVLSRDKDLGQVLGHDRDQLWDSPGGTALDRAGYRERHGIWPEQVPDLLALTGDAIDDVPGVPGIGTKTATALLADYPDVEHVLAAIPEIATSKRRSAARIAAALEAHAQQVRMARRLTALAEDAIAETPAFARRPADPDELERFAAEHGFGERLTARLLRVTEHVG